MLLLVEEIILILLYYTSNTSKELKISLYRLSWEEALKIAWKQKLLWESCRQMKISEYAICNLKKNALNEINWYTRLYANLYISHNLSQSRTESLIKLLWSYSEFLLRIYVFNYRRRHQDLCYSIVILHVLSRILENTCERKNSLLIML